jgi:hypothetical protein
MRVQLLIGIAVIGGIAGLAEAFDHNDLTALQTTVHDLCVHPDKKGSYLKVEGDLGAGAILKVLGVRADGKITKEDWDGINQRLDQCKTDPRQCAMSLVATLAPLLSPGTSASATPRPDPNRVPRYTREFDVTRESPEMGGSHNQGEWCTNVIGTLRGEHPQGQFSVVTSGEHINNHCSPFNCPQYVYKCTVHVKTDPV